MKELGNCEWLRVKPKKSVVLKEIETDTLRGVPSKEEAIIQTGEHVRRIAEYQDRLYAEGRQSLLVILQGMDAAGKDGAVRKVFDAVNPTGIQVTSFKQPSSDELRHDFLWRCHVKAPPRGYIGVFNRSYYEDVLVVRVHADTLLAPELQKQDGEWKRRYRMICDFEGILADAGTRVVKFFLHISKDEQRKRFLARQSDSEKHWKLDAGDFAERGFWKDYQKAYENMIPATTTDANPWYIIPADHKWVRDFWMSRILDATLKDMNPQPPTLKDKSLVTRKFK